MLWDVIFEFFVQYVFGGVAPDGLIYNGFLGITYNGDEIGTADVYSTIKIYDSLSESESTLIMLGNYLSLIATIITIVAIVLFCVFIIKKIIGIIFRLFTGSSAF